MLHNKERDALYLSNLQIDGGQGRRAPHDKYGSTPTTATRKRSDRTL
jgi:hypothetical protein